MEYTIGVGFVIDDDYFINIIRGYQLLVRRFTTCFVGQTQPPHITVKSPFIISGEQNLEKVFKTVELFANNQREIDISFLDFGYFGTKVIYLKPNPTEYLALAHQTLLKTLLDNNGIEPNKFEDENVVFHTTIANGLVESDFKKASVALSVKHDMSKKIRLHNIGVFLELPAQNSWVIIKTIPLVC